MRRLHPERIEQAHIVQLLRTIGGTVYVLGTTRRRGDHPGTMQSPGLPDLVAFLPSCPSVLFIEVKVPGGRMSAEQREFMRLCGTTTAVHLTGTLDSVIAWCVDQGYLRAEHLPHYRVSAPASETKA